MAAYMKQSLIFACSSSITYLQIQNFYFYSKFEIILNQSIIFY